MRYVVSKSRQLWHTLPFFVLLRELRSGGIEGVRELARARREYAALFPGKVMRADQFAPVELLVRQAGDQPAGPKIGIVVPLYEHPAGLPRRAAGFAGLRHPASAALCLRLAGRGPNSDSLFPPLAAVVVVAPTEGLC